MNRRQVTWTAVGLLGGLLLIALIAAAVISATKSTQVRATQQQNTTLLKNSSESLDLIKGLVEEVQSCTTPGRECHERNQRATANAIDSINRAAVFAAACADQRGVQGEDEIYACVIRRLAKTGH